MNGFLSLYIIKKEASLLKGSVKLCLWQSAKFHFQFCLCLFLTFLVLPSLPPPLLNAFTDTRQPGHARPHYDLVNLGLSSLSVSGELGLADSRSPGPYICESCHWGHLKVTGEAPFISWLLTINKKLFQNCLSRSYW